MPGDPRGTSTLQPKETGPGPQYCCPWIQHSGFQRNVAQGKMSQRRWKDLLETDPSKSLASRARKQRHGQVMALGYSRTESASQIREDLGSPNASPELLPHRTTFQMYTELLATFYHHLLFIALACLRPDMQSLSATNSCPPSPRRQAAETLAVKCGHTVMWTSVDRGPLPSTPGTVTLGPALPLCRMFTFRQEATL